MILKVSENHNSESAPKSHPMNQLLKSEIVFNW